MNRNNLFIASLCWIAIISPAAAQIGAASRSNPADSSNREPVAEDQMSYVLVRAANDSEQVQKGLVIDDGARYEIRLAERSSLWVPKHQVLFIGQSIDDIYAYRVKRVIHWGAGDHFQMSRWCLQHGLLSHAAEHYSKVAALHPEHASVRQLGVEMKEKMLDDKGFRQFLGLPEPERPTRLASQAASKPGAAADSIVVQASTASESPLVLRHFSQTIQPILKNRCSQAACHGYRSKNGLRIIHPYGEQAAEITARNLEQVRKFLESDGTSDPPLIRFAVTAHGPARSPAISERELPLIQELFGFAALHQNRVVPAVAQSETDPSRAQVGHAGGISNAPGAVRPQPVPGGAQQLTPSKNVQQQFPINREGQGSSVSPTSAPGSQAELMREIDALELELEKQLNQPPASKPQTPGRSTAGSPQTPAINESDPFDAAEFNSKRNQRKP